MTTSQIAVDTGGKFIGNDSACAKQQATAASRSAGLS